MTDSRPVRKRLLGIAPLLALAGMPLLVGRFATEPPVAHSGGFGEPSCHTCHFDEPLNDPAGELVVEGIPRDFSPGEAYRLVLRVSRPGSETAGFQLTARWSDGPRAGEQAGSLRPVDRRVSINETGAGIQYASHNVTSSGLRSAATGEWTVEWTAPPDVGAVVFHAAGNAGNGDNSAYGDFIYTDSLRIVGQQK